MIGGSRYNKVSGFVGENTNEGSKNRDFWDKMEFSYYAVEFC